jgi:gamma-D-glutamyl-L-lysine dipeptidyl-peptidase
MVSMLAAAAAAWAVAAEAAPARQAVVVAAVENMYSAPDPAKDVVSQARLGEVVDVLEARGGFAHVRTPDRYAGWVPAAALFTYADAATPRYAAEGAVVEVTSLLANLYRDPDVTTARPTLQAPLGSLLEVVQAPLPERWIRVRLPSGEAAYVQKGDVRRREAGAPRARGTDKDLVATARRFLGIPYLWGGMTPLGVDCSGFVSQVYGVNGVGLPRDAHQQFDDPRARPVEKDDLRSGDLLFFGKTKITHVGLYLGEGRFIHATTHVTPVVQESDLAEAHWTDLYRGARRWPAP